MADAKYFSNVFNDVSIGMTGLFNLIDINNKRVYKRNK